MNFAEIYQGLCQADSPDKLWALIERVIPEYPLYQDGKSVDSVLASANSVVLYGAGRFAEAVIAAWHEKGYPMPAYCVDSNPKKWGTVVAGIPVQSPQHLFGDTTKPLVVVAAMNTHGIETTLQEQRIPFLYAEQDGSVGYLSGHWIYQNKGKFERVFSMLADDFSRRVFMATAIARMFQMYHFEMQGNLFLIDVVTLPQYFPHEILTFSEGEFLIDCGAFDGDTLVSFFSHMNQFGIKDCRAISFEADKENVKKVNRTIERYGLKGAKVVSAAVGKSNANTDASRYHNCRDVVESTEVAQVALDQALAGMKPTMIKMDIEAAELDGMIGAKEIMTKYRPKLAICTYHLTSHLVEIPLYLLENHPDYKVFIRHHASGSLWETVCYAQPRQ